ncbi:hypothetical protein OC861_000417 [Tilletia horrida]|nr:hypothetical protein OC845_001860 [Tilletia horrida]KAK0569967.1 hypothetical protein OC861_000417 [Tilletia horrida]
MADPKRRRLSKEGSYQGSSLYHIGAEEGDTEGKKQCIICLSEAVDPTLLPACSHDHWCFVCIVGWATLQQDGRDQSRPPASCPLCKTPIGPFVVHHLRGKHDASRYYLRPPSTATDIVTKREFRIRHRIRSTSSHRSSTQPDPEQSLERTLAFRSQIYKHLVFSKHVASNRFTKWRPLPPPSSFRNEISRSSQPNLVGVSNWSPAKLQSRALAFLRRELLLFPHLHMLDNNQLGRNSLYRERQQSAATPSVSFVITYILSLLQTLDLRSDTMARLLAEFLCTGSDWAAAELFAHELTNWLRSPYRRLEDWDRSEFLQYDFAGVPSVKPRSSSSTNRSRSRNQDRPLAPGLPSPRPLPSESDSVSLDQDPQKRQQDRRTEVRDLRASLLQRLEVERELAQKHLAARLAQDVKSAEDVNCSEAQPLTTLEDHGGECSESVVDTDKEARLRVILQQRMAERRQAPAEVIVDDASHQTGVHEATTDSVPEPGPNSSIPAEAREAALRDLLRGRRSNFIAQNA